MRWTQAELTNGWLGSLLSVHPGALSDLLPRSFPETPNTITHGQQNRILLVGWESWEIRYGITPVTSEVRKSQTYISEIN